MKPRKRTPSSPERLVAFEDVTIGYRGSPLFRGIQLEICRGDFLGLIGPNGSGKSTLLKTALGVIPPLNGQVRRASELVVGYVPQLSEIDPIYPFTALEVVRSGGLGKKNGKWWWPWGRMASADSGCAALSRVGLEALAARPFRSLSGGQRQRVLVARALVRDPDLLVLDEPTAGMDLPTEKQLLDFITDLNRETKIAVVLVAHQISLVAGRARHIALLNQEIGFFHEGPAHEILTDGRLSELYHHPMVVATDDAGHKTVRAGDSEAGVS